MLKQCDECQKQVSDKAPTCPNCGAPIALLQGAQVNDVLPKRAGSSYETWGALMTITGIFWGMASKNELSILLLVVGFIVFIIGRLK